MQAREQVKLAKRINKTLYDSNKIVGTQIQEEVTRGLGKHYRRPSGE